MIKHEKVNDIKQNTDKQLKRDSIPGMIKQIETDLELLKRVERKELIRNMELEKDPDYFILIKEHNLSAFIPMTANKVQSMIKTQKDFKKILTEELEKIK